MTQRMKGWLRLEIPRDPGAGMEARFILVVEKVDVSSFHGHRGEDQHRSHQPLRLLFVGHTNPLGSVTTGTRLFRAAIVSKFRDPDRFACRMLLAPLAKRVDILQVPFQLWIFWKTSLPCRPSR